MKRFTQAILTAALCSSLPALADATDAVARGRYLVEVADCNGCHTAGFAESGGAVPEADRLTGMNVGFSGPWGVSYPANLRLSAAGMSERDWLARARAGGLPPMPWPALKAMSDTDLRAIYAYLRALGPAGVAAPGALPPGAPIPTAHFVFVPQPPTRVASAAGKH
ncbi:c-type cytochrome [Denitromonas iodatirespirans]|uniref:C-type cytochrome n=1 Tax=Denitromonas iodatirespirans TaxID=2795389 RepID=A0A944DBT3_DENI1|nr:c-type cytochrome [Denitromonas iodatirespirans]MBT0963599.1 c-type cytochrome [Denitromonas iodatirespirans]